jgi:hypothetical protein
MASIFFVMVGELLALRVSGAGRGHEITFRTSFNYLTFPTIL